MRRLAIRGWNTPETSSRQLQRWNGIWVIRQGNDWKGYIGMNIGRYERGMGVFIVYFVKYISFLSPEYVTKQGRRSFVVLTFEHV